MAKNRHARPTRGSRWKGRTRVLWVQALLSFYLVQGHEGRVASRAAEGPHHLRAEEESQILQKVQTLGGRFFRDGDRVVEVKLDRTQVTDEDLRLVARLPEVTDLSLEQTQV